MTEPILPTRIIPAGAPLPARSPKPDELPPWRTPPPPPPPPPMPLPPQEVVVHHVHEILLVAPEPPPEPDEPRLWERLFERLVTWRILVAILAAILPWAGGQSPVGIWSGTLHQARTEASIGAAYVIAGVAIAAAWGLDRHTGRAVPRFLLVTALLGSFGVLHWWDPILMLTGVSR